jgi:phage repressor protein C with HTH and peptisase S24 domain
MLAVAEKGGFADRLKDLRAKLRINQENMAERLGTERSTYKNWEYGVASPPAQVVKIIEELEAEVSRPLTPAYELEVPLRSIGAVAASQQVDWTDPFDSDDFEDVPGHMGGPRGRFACRVASDSMMPLLHPNDLCVWQASSIPRIGAVILYRHPDNRITIKQLKHDGMHYLLHPLNEAYEDEIGRGQQIAYLVGIVRKIGKRTITDHDDDGIRP